MTKECGVKGMMIPIVPPSLFHYTCIITPIRGINKDASGHEKGRYCEKYRPSSRTFCPKGSICAKSVTWSIAVSIPNSVRAARTDSSQRRISLFPDSPM